MELLKKYWPIIAFILGLTFSAGKFYGEYTQSEKLNEKLSEKTEHYLTELIILRAECAK